MKKPSDFAVGVDLGGTKISSGLVHRPGSISLLRRVATPNRKGGGAGPILSALEREIKRVLDSQQASGVNRVGIGVAGQLAKDKRTVSFSPNLPSICRFPLVQALEDSLGVAVTLENDARCFTIAQATLGAAKGFSRVLGVTLGTGVGGGFYADGHIHDGSHCCAGEIGHTLVDYSGEKCGCGSHGCLEQYASGTAISRLSRKMLGKKIDASELALLARRGQAGPKRVFESAGSFLGAGLASAANLLDPQVIVLGGSVSNSMDLFGPSMRKEFRLRALGPVKQVPILKAKLKEPGVVGAALSAMG